MENVTNARLLKVLHKYFLHYDNIHSMVTDLVVRDMSRELTGDRKRYMLDLLEFAGPRAAMQLDAANKTPISSRKIGMEMKTEKWEK